MRILMIAPTRADLPNVAAEAAAVVNAHGGILLQGEVLERDLRDAASQGGFDGVWFATHSTGGEVLLSSEALGESPLIAYVAASGASWVFFNSCTSILLAQRVVDQTAADVICTIAEAPDSLAMRTGVVFARQLAVLGNVRAAYERSRPGDNRTYVYLRGRGLMNGTVTAGGSDRLLQLMDQLQRDVSAMAGDLKVLKMQQDSVEQRLTRIEQQLRPSSTWQTWIMLVAGLVMAAVLIVALLRLGAG